MRKGERRRRDILNAAEKLFYEKGYEHTSVQDILDALELSKGGFYHHFESKQSVIVEICEERSSQMYDEAVQIVKKESVSPINKLNELFRRADLLEHKDDDYILLMLNASYAQDSCMLRESMRKVSLKKLVPAVNEVILQGMAAGEIYTRYPDLIGEQIVLLWLELLEVVMEAVLRCLDQPEEVVCVIDRLNCFRTSMELILNAPYGSVKLADADTILTVTRRLSKKYRAQRLTVQAVTP